MRSASDGVVYVRRGAQSLPVVEEERIRRLRLSKGVISHEDETLGVPIDEITNSVAILGFMLDVIPESEPEAWLRKQRMILEDRPTVSGALIFADEPQVALPKADVKFYRYKTAESEGSRETLAFDPMTRICRRDRAGTRNRASDYEVPLKTAARCRLPGARLNEFKSFSQQGPPTRAPTDLEARASFRRTAKCTSWGDDHPSGRTERTEFP